MLPPVRATISSFAEHQAPDHALGQQPVLRPRIDLAGGAADTALPISGGRLDIMSLSAQLQLANGFSVFAETVGKLIKLPRRDGEALVDYARRIVEAVRTMTPGQQAALEKVLNQLVKGVSLQLLIQILGNPAGPDAARLALRLETAQLLGRDAAAKAAVSSYRQNGGRDTAPAIQLPPAGAASQKAPEPSAARPTPTPAGPAAAGAAPHADATPALPAPATVPHGSQETAAGSEATVAHSELPAGKQASSPTPVEAASQDTGPTKAPTRSGEPVAHAVAGTSAPETDRTTAAIATSGEAHDMAMPETVSAETTQTDPAPSADPAVGRDRVQSGAPAAAARQPAAAQFYDGPALARLSERGLDQHAGASAASALARPATVAAMTEWLAEVFADSATDLFTPLSIAAEPRPEQQALQELFGRDTLIPARSLSTESAYPMRPEQAGQPEGTMQAAPEAHLAAKYGAAGSQTTHAAELSEQLALPLMLPQALRDGIPLPYVAYPPEDRERDPEERKTKPVTETDEDGEQQHSAGEQAFRDDRRESEPQEAVPEDGEQQAIGHQDTGYQAGAGSAEDEGRPNDFYWRMAGWT